MAEKLKSVIVQFKPKDKRSNRKEDKTQLLSKSIGRELSFVNCATLTSGEAAMPRSLAVESVAFDVDEYEAPIVTLTVSDKELAALRKDANIESVEADGKMYAMGLHETARLQFEGQPSVLAETVPWGIAAVKAPDAWDCSRGKGVRVAVLDTGIDGKHPDLAPNYKGGISFVPNETTPADGNGHGTHCAGTIAAAIDGQGVVGVAPAAWLYAVKVLSASGSGNWSWLIAGLDWCIKNEIRIASMSMGGATAPAALETMCDLAFKKGILLVGAAGNDNGAVIAPARYKSVIAVSAIDSANAKASFSCFGPEVELCAPGVQVLSTKPGGGHQTLNGTSMACPHVSGAAAVAWGAHRFADNITIRRLLAATADNLGVPGRDPIFGFGRVDADQAAFQFTPPPPIPGIP